MKVIRAQVLGFCMGVRRAVELATTEAQRAKSGGFCTSTLGPLIHNPKVLADLKALGVSIIEEASLFVDCAPKLVEDSLIIRAHGISPVIEEKLRESGCRIVDATCPKVKASQLMVQKLSRLGFRLFLAGEAHHAEIAGLLGYAESANKDDSSQFSETQPCVVVSSTQEAGKAASELYKTSPNAKTSLLGQTTISEDEYRNISFAIKNYFPDLEIADTICAATAERQSALRELLTKTDAVIIAGGRESANTRRLLAIAQESGKPCALAENAGEIPPDFHNYGTIGLCAGASTPDCLVDEIEAAFLNV